MIVYTAFAMPFCVWNMRASFQSVPNELEEAAFLEGATPLVAFWRITLPLALPAIAVAGLMAFLIGYTEFAIGWLFVESGENVTLAMAVSGMMGISGPWSNQVGPGGADESAGGAVLYRSAALPDARPADRAGRRVGMEVLP